MKDYSRYEDFFKEATEKEPYPYQIKLANAKELPYIISIPTGGGKTAAIVLAWLWRRRYDSRFVKSTPRRLIYCLPMRTLVEQVKRDVEEWLKNLNLYGDESEGSIPVTILMGGEKRGDWDIFPEKDQIIVGTQDMLLSRALNRGFAMNPFRWPMHFGLLNNDSLWVMDEIQLMGSGLTTSLQLQGFREAFKTFKPTHTVWMSATVAKEQLQTRDFAGNLLESFLLSPDDMENYNLRKIVNAKKILRRFSVEAKDKEYNLANEILSKTLPNSRTIVILNTVKRAVELYDQLEELLNGKYNAPRLTLIHSRFRPPDREKAVDEMLSEPGSNGAIVVSTQVIEAGVNISSRVMFTELAPIPSLIQRFGRCNRKGEYDEASIYWLDVGDEIAPYTQEEMAKAREMLLKLEGTDVSPNNLKGMPIELRQGPVIRKKDLVELFDTSHDLAGGEVDISRYVRDTVDSEVLVYWRDVPNEHPSPQEPHPSRNELCPVLLNDAKQLLSELWRWNPRDSEWERPSSVHPGMVLLMSSKSGHYDERRGWSIKSSAYVKPVKEEKASNDNFNADFDSVYQWKSIAEHSDDVVNKAKALADRLELDADAADALTQAARWHDAGKAHEAFQAKLRYDSVGASKRPAAKAPKEAWISTPLIHSDGDDKRRKYFRHELVSALLAIQNGKSDLVAYLVAAHHGKVRLSIRSMPGESVPDSNKLFAMGVWDGDSLPGIDLGGGTVVKPTSIDLSVMRIGGNGKRSWLDRMTELRDVMGPFKLAYLESLIRASDERASGAEK